MSERFVVWISTSAVVTWLIKHVASRLDPLNFKATNGLNQEVALLSTLNQVDGSIDIVLPADALLGIADSAQQAAAGITDPLQTVALVLWWDSRCEGNVEDFVPNRNDSMPPTIVTETSLFEAFFLEVNPRLQVEHTVNN